MYPKELFGRQGGHRVAAAFLGAELSFALHLSDEWKMSIHSSHAYLESPDTPYNFCVEGSTSSFFPTL